MEDPGHNHNLDQAKLSYNCINKSMSNVCNQNPHIIFWAPQRAFSTSVLCSKHTLSSRLQNVPLHCCCSLGDHPMVLASLKYWDLLLQLGCTFTYILSYTCVMVPSLKWHWDWNWTICLARPLPSAKAPLLSMIASYLQNHDHPGDS